MRTQVDELLFPKPERKPKGGWRTRRYPLKRGGRPRASRVPALVDLRALERRADDLWRHIVYAKEPSGLCPVCNRRQWHDAMHGFIRGRYRTTRWDPDNGIPGCRPCHRQIDSDHEAKRELWVRYIGDERYAQLTLRAMGRGKVDVRATIHYLEHYLSWAGTAPR